MISLVNAEQLVLRTGCVVSKMSFQHNSPEVVLYYI